MKKILVPSDFSKSAIGAYRQALDIAAQSGGTIHLLHVIEPPLLNDPMFMPALGVEEELMKELKEDAEDQFKKIFNEYKSKNVKTVSGLRYGAVSTSILDYAHENSIDFIIMGSTGASGIKEYILGSNAERIVRLSTVPVLVVKEYYEWPIRNIVFPNHLDTEDQDALVSKVKALQDFFSARLHVVRINTPANFMIDTVTRKQLNDFVTRHMLHNCTINIFNHTSTEEGIRGFADLLNADIIAMGTHSFTGLNRFMSGSIAEDLVNHTKRPVWTYTLKREPVVMH
jgi:nucleotide-binding universal stress UspA family protein